MAEFLPGAPVAERLTQDLKARSDALRQRGVTPTLAIIRVGRDPGGLAYEKGAASRCAKCGIDLRRIPLDDAASLPEVIRSVNDDPAIHGCLLLRPLADKAAEEAAGRLLSPDKDVDENRDLALQYGIESIPTLLVFKGGQMADRSVGLVSPQEILDLVK